MHYKIIRRWSDGNGVQWATAVCNGRTVTISYRNS